VVEEGAAIEQGVCSIRILCVGLTARRVSGFMAEPSIDSPIQWPAAGKDHYDNPHGGAACERKRAPVRWVAGPMRPINETSEDMPISFWGHISPSSRWCGSLPHNSRSATVESFKKACGV
jgi:hypothetical protein